MIGSADFAPVDKASNISARQIRDDAARRASATATATANPTSNAVAAAAGHSPAAVATTQGNDTRTVVGAGRGEYSNGQHEEEEEYGDDPVPSAAQRQAKTQDPKRNKQDLKRNKQSQATAKNEKAKTAKKRKLNRDEDEGYDSETRAILQELRDDRAREEAEDRAEYQPGQMHNCWICAKRFTITPYSRTGPNGAILCTKCGKDVAKEDGTARKPRKKTDPAIGRRRRKQQSDILDGTYSLGAKSLLTVCIETLAKNIDLADDLGDMPPPVVDRIARILSKRRLVNSHNLRLFVRPDATDVMVYDGSRLRPDDYKSIFQICSKIRNLKLKNSIQFRDEVMDYLMTRQIQLETVYVHGANLVSEERWLSFLQAKGQHLRSLRIYYTDKHVGDDMVAALAKTCPNLRRLKISHNQKLTDKGVEHIAGIKGLEHLGLQLLQRTTTMPYVTLLKGIGSTLRTLSLAVVPELDDRVLDGLHENCRHLSKLRITDNETMTDSGFVRLFKDWANPGLSFIDFQKCRYMSANACRIWEKDIGLRSNGFRALMQHSGQELKWLNIHACCNISRDAFEDVFSEKKVYPNLIKAEVSFCEAVDDFIVGCIFRSCPKLQELNVFGCLRLRHVKVPRGRILVGMPNAVGMRVEGEDDG